MMGLVLAYSASREDPPLAGMGTTHASSIEVEAMGEPCTDGGSKVGRKVSSSWQDATLTSNEASPMAEVVLFVIERGSLA